MEVSICYGDSYYAGGEYQTISGVYSDTLTSVFGCDSIVHTDITVNQPTESIINHTICPGDTYFFNGEELTTEGIYTSILTSESGCDSLITLNLYIGENGENCCTSVVFAPNCFTPNNDGVNDVFRVSGDCIEEIELLIFNRWGNLIFTSTSLQLGWDGRTLTGIIAPDGVYVYLLKYKSIEKSKYRWVEKRGHVTLFR